MYWQKTGFWSFKSLLLIFLLILLWNMISALLVTSWASHQYLLMFYLFILTLNLHRIDIYSVSTFRAPWFIPHIWFYLYLLSTFSWIKFYGFFRILYMNTMFKSCPRLPCSTPTPSMCISRLSQSHCLFHICYMYI